MVQRIILADTQVIFRTGAARVLAMEGDFHVAAQCGDATELLQAADRMRDAIAIFPSGIADDLGSMLERMERSGSRSVVIVEHGATLTPSVARLANGIVQRSVAGAELVGCLRRVAGGERCVMVDRPEAPPTKDRIGTRVLERLTPKELQILALVTDGCKNKEIAAMLNTTEQVIKNYLRAIYDKTGVSDRLELAVFTAHHRALSEAATRARHALTGTATIRSHTPGNSLADA